LSTPIRNIIRLAIKPWAEFETLVASGWCSLLSNSKNVLYGLPTQRDCGGWQSQSAIQWPRCRWGKNSGRLCMGRESIIYLAVELEIHCLRWDMHSPLRGKEKTKTGYSVIHCILKVPRAEPGPH
jgi:hypothetical protein